MNEQEMKTCTVCSASKPTSMFYKNKATKDGLSCSCGACNRAEKRKHYWHGGGKEVVAAYGRTPARKEYYKSERHKESQRKYFASAKGKAHIARRDRRYAQRWPDKIKAHSAISMAVGSKELPPITTCTCLECGSPAESRHHYLGYAKEHWLDVIELCNPCHRTIDIKE